MQLPAPTARRGRDFVARHGFAPFAWYRIALGGIALITACDIVARVINMPFEVPVSLILAMVGSVVFIALLLRQRRRA